MPGCLLPDLVEDSRCLDCLSSSEKKKAFLFYLAQALNALGGEDLTDINDLRQAIACWCVGGARLDSFEAQVGINLAVNSDAIATAPTAAEVREAIRCWCDLGADELKTAQVVLLCGVLENLVAG